jgi:hypothetical protein
VIMHGYKARGAGQAAALALLLLSFGPLGPPPAPPRPRQPNEGEPDDELDRFHPDRVTPPRQEQVELLGKRARKEYSRVLRDTGDRELALAEALKVEQYGILTR